MTLTFACWGYDRTEAIRSGAVPIKGFDVDCLELGHRDIFDRMGSKQEFSAAEFSFCEFVMHFAGGDSPFVAIPVFPSKVFRHSFIFINRGADIRTPKDLEGKRIGVPLYTMTAALWQRGLLQDEYGVDWRGMIWVQGAINAAGAHSQSTGIPKLLKPANIVQADPGKSLTDLLISGEIDAAMGAQAPDCGPHPAIGRLFPDFRPVERDYYIRTSLFPIMHLIAIRKDVHEASPGFAQALYTAMEEAKTMAMAKQRHTGANAVMMPFLAADLEEIRTVFGGDPYAYGIEANRKTLETQIRYMVEQDYIPEAIPLEDLFLKVG
jgi:4,5-dihydroxyphthalate decarboxylase